MFKTMNRVIAWVKNAGLLDAQFHQNLGRSMMQDVSQITNITTTRTTMRITRQASLKIPQHPNDREHSRNKDGYIDQLARQFRVHFYLIGVQFTLFNNQRHLITAIAIT